MDLYFRTGTQYGHYAKRSADEQQPLLGHRFNGVGSVGGQKKVDAQPQFGNSFEEDDSFDGQIIFVKRSVDAEPQYRRHNGGYRSGGQFGKRSVNAYPQFDHQYEKADSFVGQRNFAKRSADAKPQYRGHNGGYRFGGHFGKRSADAYPQFDHSYDEMNSFGGPRNFEKRSADSKPKLRGHNGGYRSGSLSMVRGHSGELSADAQPQIEHRLEGHTNGGFVSFGSLKSFEKRSADAEPQFGHLHRGGYGRGLHRRNGFGGFGGHSGFGGYNGFGGYGGDIVNINVNENVEVFDDFGGGFDDFGGGFDDFGGDFF